ncbi:MAG TPA: alpha/beta hydrolase [Candidatus Dormibacteraeota bacterium]
MIAPNQSGEGEPVRRVGRDPGIEELQSQLDRWMGELGLAVRHHYVATASGRVHALAAGSGRDAVILLPGLAASAGEFGRLIRRLAQRHLVVAIDRPGTGLSDPVRFRGHPRAPWVAVVKAVADHLGLTTMTVVGHSVGGLVAGAFAIAHPERVSRLVLVSPLGLRRSIPLTWNVLLLPGALEAVMAADRARRVRLMPRTAALGPRGESETSPMGAYRIGVARRFAQGSDLSLLTRLMRPRSLRPESLLLPQLALLADRTLVVWGADDRDLRLAPSERALLGHPSLRLRVVAGQGHSLPFAKPGLLADLIRNG